MAKYFQTPTGYGYLEVDSDPLPDGATQITQAQYEALVQAQQAAQDQANADALAASNARWTQVHDDLAAAGVAEATAVILADAVGQRPVAEQ
jgi:hypothetical protein